ncbi:helix-turn-helix domain-containing protein [Aliarcobacter butzleri]|uniref:helix-turn-helix domain-containing protein n=1 Tax=Aliarcobacter butzleri TaxID=28197 RepID=UPI002B2456B8|nr:helix-turn-helix domain-containing protein [Aliarcobacter butzleri]
MNIEIILQRLLDYFDLDNISQLADKLSVSQPTISKWKSRGSILPIKKICRELGIYNEIFGDLNNSDSKKLIKKIKTAYQISTNPELANKLKLTVSAIEQWSKKNKVPEKYIFQCITDTGVSLQWLLDEDKPTFDVVEKSIFNDNINKTLEIINTMTKNSKELENNFYQLLKDFIKENI